jgi:hypothetical protein
MELLFLIVVIAIGAALVRGYYHGGVTGNHQQLALTAEQGAQYAAWIKSCTDQYQPARMICGPVPGGFDGDEEVLAVFPDVNLMEPRAVRHSRGAYGGPTIRLAKGLSFRLGGAAGRSESVDELRAIDFGTLVLTSKRLAFLGSMRTNSVDLCDLISLQPYSDGIAVHREHKQKAETYVLTRPLTIADDGGRGLPVYGTMMKAAIEIAKIIGETKPEAIALLRHEKLAVVQHNFKSPYVAAQEGRSPLQYGSLYRTDV